MRLFKHQILILLLCAFVILAGSSCVILGLNIEGRHVAAANTKIQTDLTTCGEIIDLKYPGPWSVRDGELYKGAVRISLNNEITDYLSRLTGDSVTIFLGESRAATTERGLDGVRLISTKVSAHVAQTVLQNGQTYLGEEDQGGQLNQAGYVPLRAESGEVIGMFNIGIAQGDGQIVWTGSWTTLIKVGLALIIAFAFFTWIYLQKLRRGLLDSILPGPQQSAAGSLSESSNDSSVEEIGELKKAFDSMAEQIQGLTEEINRANSSQREKDQADNKSLSILQLMKDSAAIDHTAAKGSEPEVSLDSPWYSEGEGLPKGLSKITLNHIVQFLEATRRPLSAEEVAEGVKLTRVTVRHYLEFLEQRGVLKSELKYGTGGRPVKLFILL
ncbi:response regulator of citrate/malate metabolism [Desulfosporosinus orientis DSM 765]|uniref:Response regulator of citrate/malate metabolism n=1 Tax=Desulfosporosinus orientis (strain ATCC 19365 / DSM 765 / NCIMB 8382 / VKM B-1628 / Singapore I) TaxID=768706 RepID=G7WD19_DESOD|nr:cache domain-containing protein [Desulfosporosinus orientis]AET67214.1 response regulator of citrate/malate metabolism [Desulfosporosinus orientis DSM 765]